jgi:hypothetical protein
MMSLLLPVGFHSVAVSELEWSALSGRCTVGIIPPCLSGHFSDKAHDEHSDLYNTFHNHLQHSFVSRLKMPLSWGHRSRTWSVRGPV